ncbi:hypothetical protein [Acinetobacter sp. MD2(2019)]|uniref:hypothetical protein n=1 Tax=Acinetobacter sp. MD2(2019) TaxID=2605273 RepID=UPI002D1EC2AC|nr:hypothetical protein [Acinetobacter sp. MD2(2019)]MEB3754163.1 hypothetical protein [Acinetobacter sp. MD2(2019)]
MFKDFELTQVLYENVYIQCEIDISLIDEEYGGVYTGYLDDLYMYVDARLFKKRLSKDAHKHIKYWFYGSNNQMENLTKYACRLPIAWLVWSKFLLAHDYLPSDFQPLAMQVLEWFDLDRYNAAYNLPEEEYEVIKHDLPLVIDQLKNYPTDKFAPPVGEK